MFGFLRRLFGTAQDRLLKKYWKRVADVNLEEEKLKSLTNEQLQAKTAEFRRRVAAGETLDDLLPEAYAVVKNACRRLSGTPVHVSGYDQLWDMIPYDVQVVGAIAMHAGTIAEMHTGEGKTLTAVMPLYLNSLTGEPVHLVTVNDYLAKRDCEWVGAVLRFLGLTTGVLTNETPQHLRKDVYKSDVVYGTSSEFGFDYLRDNSMATHAEDQVQRGYFFAIIDEVDSILIDEARTPLIISGPAAESKQMYEELKLGAAELVKRQRELCNSLVVEAKKIIESLPESTKRTKAEESKFQEAIRKLWLVSKGMPRHKALSKLKEDPDLRAALDKCDLYYHADQNKDEKFQMLGELYLTIDERTHEFELTDKGIHIWPECEAQGTIEDFVMIDISHEYTLIDEDEKKSDQEKMQAKLAVQEEDTKRKERAHNLRQLLRAHLTMERDVDYIIHEGKIVIIDENTGRPQPGRRFSDGLHQAIEAKEGVAIQKETQTYATITLQNYFRMYKKLAGMTGTATTEAQELKEIYKIDVLEIPPNRPSRRVDSHDEVYMTEREKYSAMVKDIQKANQEGRPVLVGTESVDVSEKLSRILRQNKVEHTVLNARHHEREAEIIAHAGKHGAVTIATNMAGRGTDIKLQPGVANVGGLYVIGTTRHKSRRIDRQLRGRSGRQGDPGASKFFLSFEDELLRLFAGSSLSGLIQRFRPNEGEAISASMLDKSIEVAQKRIEQRNYTMRKHTLEYDDVMNKQRQEIYAFRNELLHTKDLKPVIDELLERVCERAAHDFFVSRGSEGGWDPIGYREYLMQQFPVSFPESIFDDDRLEADEIGKLAGEQVKAAFAKKMIKEEENGEAIMKMRGLSERPPLFEMMRDMMVRQVDRLWQEHLLVMDHLRTDVSLRAVGQRDPLLEFKQESFRLFDEFSKNLSSQMARALFAFHLVVRPENVMVPPPASFLRFEKDRSFIEGG